MDWITENPIADMYGPAFLMFYTLVIGITLVCCWWTLHSGRNATPPTVPQNPDPLEIAYLRGGANEVLRLTLFDLFRRGYLSIEGTGANQKIGQAAPGQNPVGLSALEQAVFAAFKYPMAAGSVFSSAAMRSITPLCRDYESDLQGSGLLEIPGTHAENVQIGLAGAVIIVGLGLYKFAVAIQHGHHNVGFLLVMLMLGLIILAAVCIPNRLTKRGKAYVRQMQQVFAGLRTPSGQTAYGIENAHLLCYGLFGAGILLDTEYNAFAALFRQSTVSSGSGCGASSSSCGGGGCGGGGCGGGGCGGGCGGCGGS